MKLSIVIPGNPQGKARARTCKTGYSYTPENTVLYENLIKMSFLGKYGARGKIKSQGKQKIALKLEIYAGFQIPKSFSNKDRIAALSGDLLPTKKPDSDNIAKVVADALNGIAYDDDAQITDLTVIKRYTETPCVKVTIEEISHDL
jgi:Holliday junction resolvase RusA-like endonuclease